MDDLDFEDAIFEDNLMNMVEIVNPNRRQNTIRPRPDNLNVWDEVEFIRRFRISKQSVERILPDIENDLAHRTDRNHALPPLQQFLLTLRFLATGSFYITIADFGGIHKSTVCTIVQRVVNALVQLRPQYIKFPQTQEEKTATVLQFSRIARFPRVLGAIDCTHVRLQSPGGQNAEIFRNRKGYFSLNVQVVCDANTHITDVVARWPGSTHDTQIFNNSSIMMRFETGEMNNLLLLGDSGYPLKEYLVTPLNEPRTEGENLYNEAHIRTRNVVERTFGIWKRRFPVLSIGLRCRLPLAQKIVVATAILHNIACSNHDELPVQEDVAQLELNFPEERNVQRQENNFTRVSLIDYFQTLL